MNPSDERLIRKPEARALTGLSPSSMDRMIRDGDFPRPIQLVPNGRAVGFQLTAVRAWIADRIASATDARAAA